MIIDCGITSASSVVMSEKLIYMAKLEMINFGCKTLYEIGNMIGDAGCYGIFKCSKYLTNLEKMSLSSNKELIMKIECGIEDASISTMLENVKYLKRLSVLILSGIFHGIINRKPIKNPLQTSINR